MVKLPKGEVGRVAATLVRQFPRCDRNDPELATPPPDYQAACVRSSVRKTYVCAQPVHNVHWSAKGDLVTGGYYSPRGGQIRVKVEANQCAPRSEWQRRLREVLRHEMTHAADPYVHVRRRPYAKATSESNFCQYVRDPVEVAANLAEVQEEILNSKRRQHITWQVHRGHISRPEEILHESPTYLRIITCLTPRIKRRFMQMTARLWAAGTFGARRPVR